jgi:hypothetical protein
MIKVMGSSPDKIDLPELHDRIYYKQEKTFTEAQYKQSHSLRHAIDMGRAIVLERSPENKEYGAPPVSDIEIPIVTPEYPPPILGKEKEPKPEPTPNAAGEDKLDLVLAKIASLEDRIDYDAGKIVVDSTPLNIILDRLKKLEDAVSGAAPAGTDSNLIMQTLKALEDKINQGQGANAEALLKKLEETVSRSGTGTSSKTQKSSDAAFSTETYVPNVTVEDANSHINLKVRTIEKSDNVNSALDALKKLKGKSK